MSEFQPQEPTPDELVYLQFGERQLSFHPSLARGFTHDDKQYDHVFIVVELSDEGEPQKFVYLFRELFDHYDSDIDEVLEMLHENEVPIVSAASPSESDVMCYEAWKGLGQMLPLMVTASEDEEVTSQEPVPTDVSTYQIPHPEENWGNTKKAQAEKWGGFVAYLAESIANGERES